MQDQRGRVLFDAGEPVGMNMTKALLSAWAALPVIGVTAFIASGNWVPLAASGAAFAASSWTAVPAAKLQWLWKTPTLQTHERNLMLGEGVEFVFERTARRPVDVSQATLVVELTCVESVSYTVVRDGKPDTETDTAVAHSSTRRYSVEPTARGLEVRGVFFIPRWEGAPTLRLGSHDIDWYLRVNLEGPRLPGDSARFELTVVPAIVHDEEQDRIQA